MAEINKIGYSTHILGTVKSVMSCLGIILYDKSDISDGSRRKRVSLYNIEEVYKLVLDSGKYLELTRETENDGFSYKHNNGKITGFNVILYLDPSNKNNPLGYTEFTNTQGEKRDTNIYLNLHAGVEDFDIRLNDNLDNAEHANKTYIGDNLKGYTSSKVILNDIDKVETGHKHYTKFLTQSIVTSDSIFLDSGIVTELANVDNLGLIKLGIERNMNYSPLEYDFENFSISYYSDDIVLSSWKDTNYCITSLTQRNSFGDLIRYTKSNTGYFTLPEDGYDNVINHTAGKYIICKSTKYDSTITRAFNVETKSWEATTTSSVFVDPFDKSNTLYKIPSSIQPNQFFRVLPDLKNIYYDYLDNEYLKVIRKVGPWFALNVKRSDKSLVLVTSVAFSLYMTPEQLDNIIFFDDNTLILKTTNSYLIYRGFLETRYTEEANKLLGGNYNTKVEVVPKDQDLFLTPLNDLRRGAYPKATGIPDIISGFKGHLFYIDRSSYTINFL